MEPAGLTIGVVGLASLFSTCMECFDYIQLGRTFGKDYGKCLLRLDAAKLRFSRWGEATGIASTSQVNDRLAVSEPDFRLAESLLQQIQDSFEDTEKISRRYQKHAVLNSPTSDALVVYDEKIDLSPQDLQIHSQLRAIASRRQKTTGLVQKTRWALYEKKKLDAMISDITEFIDKLVDLFPDAKESQTPLCENELSSIGDAEDLTKLKDIAGADDRVLQSCAEAELVRRGHIVKNWKAEDHADVWVGDENGVGVESKGHRVSEFSVSGSAKVRLGNNNKGQ
jgi:hypothetical protein